LVFGVLQGCVVKEVRTHSLQGGCYKFKNNQYLYEGKANAYRGKNILVFDKDEQIVREMKYVGVVASGRSFLVDNVVSSFNGSWGEFLRVKIKILEGPYAGTIADIPVHAPYHPREKWTKEFTLDPNALEFNEKIVAPCD
jgi:hypothetical protein